MAAEGHHDGTAGRGEAQAGAYDCVLVDDDDLVQLTWRMSAASAGKRLLVVADAAALRQRLAEIACDVPIYIDLKLTGNGGGEQLARELAGAGFDNLHLQTGYDVESVPIKAMPWIRSIVDKTPPFQE